MQNALLIRFEILCQRSRLPTGFVRQYSRLIRPRDEKTTSSSGTALSVRSDVGQQTTCLELLDQSYEGQARGGQIDEQTIFIDDLSATLEAHRARNRASIIRKIGETRLVSSGENKQHVLDDKEKQTPSASNAVSEQPQRTVNGDLLERWPADSLQARRLMVREGRCGVVKSDKVLEYKGAIEGIKSPWKIESHGHVRRRILERPWLAYLENRSEDVKDRLVPCRLCSTDSSDMALRLSREIRAFEEYMRLTPADEEASKLIISDVKSALDSGSGQRSIVLVGSRSTGLATPLSDFDFSIAPGQEEADREKSIQHEGGKSISVINKEAISSLWQVYKKLRRSKWFFDIALYNGRVSVARAKHRATGLEVQFQIRSLQLPSQAYAAECLQENPFIRPLFIVIRHLLEIRGLTKVVEGGLGSYSILMMVLTALKHAGTTEKHASLDLGGQLLYILNFYGTANLYKYGFSANPPLKFDKKKEDKPIEESIEGQSTSQLSSIDQLKTYNPQKPYLLCLKDPADKKNDLGRSAYAIKHIQKTFNAIHTQILKNLSDQSRKPDETLNFTTYSLLDGALRADYTAFEKCRSAVDRFADPNFHQTNS